MNALTNSEGNSTGNPGGQTPHQPVLYHEVLDALAPKNGGAYIDGTLGAGGHAEGILIASAPHGKLLGLDLDPEALAYANQRLKLYQGRLIIRQASYQSIPVLLNEVNWPLVDGILLDLGVSSIQIDRPHRGFSFMEDGPLDMRFNQDQGKSAADLVNNLSESDLADIIWQFGEERYARQITSAIIKARPFHSTKALADHIRNASKGKKSRIHPATRTFQALRIATNQELMVLSSSLPGLLNSLAPGGILAVISFHSLEDRIIKQFFQTESSDCICPSEQPVCTCSHQAVINVLTKKPIRPKTQEIEYNPRARSARLRIAEKI